MRTIQEIKESIAADFMRNETVAKIYGFTPGDSFTSQIGILSVENVLFYLFAVAAWTLEKLFDTYKIEVDARIGEIIPHRPRWYRDKVLSFMKGKTLITDTDRYDTEGMTEDAISAARVVKHAVATESTDASLLTIKVAGEEGGRRCKLDDESEAQLAAYIAEIKDAGVRTALVNTDPDRFSCQVDIYYDPMIVAETVEAACREAIRTYIENLPFNGEYTNMALVDAIQTVEGVRIVEFKGATKVAANETVIVPIDARCVPAAGYFTMADVQLTLKAYGNE